MSKKLFIPISSFDVHLENFQNLVAEFRKNNDVSHLINVIKDSYWTSELPVKIFQEDYDALVLTDDTQKILWVSDGFREMTGYTKKFAVGKRPSFLQGKMTSLKTKKEIREELKNNHMFSGSLLNYKKSGEVYNCKINILPIYNEKRKLEYFLALEKEIPTKNELN